MALPQDILDAFAKIDTETNNLATIITTLRDLVKTGMSADDVAVVRGNLTAVADRLTGIAADPNAPVPEPAPLAFSRSRKG